MKPSKQDAFATNKPIRVLRLINRPFTFKYEQNTIKLYKTIVRIRTCGTIILSSDIFSKITLNKNNKHKHDPSFNVKSYK